MSLYNIDENKNMVLDALFAPYSDNPRDITRGTNTNPISLNISDWIDVYGDYSLQGIDSYVITCYMAYAGIYLVIKHHESGATNGSMSLADVHPSFLSTIYVDDTTSSNGLRLTAIAYATDANDDWLWNNICYFRIIRLQ